jgi:hypothetical protein
MSKKTLIGAGTGAIMFLSSAIPALAAMPENFGGSGSAFVNDYANHYVNSNNGDVRFDWDNHRMAVPGVAYEHADDNSAVVDNGGYSLVDPLGTL